MKGGIGWNLSILGVDWDPLKFNLMFLSQEIDIKLCQIYTKIYIYKIWKQQYPRGIYYIINYRSDRTLMGHDQELEGSAIPPFIFLYSPLKSSLNLLFSGVLNLLHFKHWLKWFAFSLYPFHFSYTVPLRFLAKLGNFAFRSLKNGNVCFFREISGKKAKIY